MDTATLDAIKAEIAGIQTFVAEKLDAGVKPVAVEIDRLTRQVLDVQAMVRDSRRAQLATSPTSPIVPEGKYAGLSRDDVLLANSIARAIGSDGHGVPEKFEDWKANIAAALDSTTVGSGDELVPTVEHSDLWMDVNLATAIWSQFRHFNMPSSPWDIPLQLGSVNFYPGTENVASKSTAPGTGKKTMTAFELVGEVPLSFVLEEDSVVAIIPAIRAQLTEDLAELLDDIALNADTTTLNNINADGATIADTDAGKAQWLVGFDGLRHLPLVDATGQGNNHNAAVSDDMFNENRRNMGKYAVRPDQCIHIMDISTYLISQTLTNFRTLDKFGPQATILTGQLGAVEGIPVIVSEKMLKTASDGKVTDGTPGTVGGLLTVNTGQWWTGNKRQITIETERSIQKRQTLIVASLRVGMIQREKTIADATHTALQYNITGV